MKRLIITASLLGGMLFRSRAQEVTIGINTAQSGASYKLPYGSSSVKPSFGGELGLQIPVSHHLNLITGLEAFRYKSAATLADNQVYSYNQADDMVSYFEYRVTTKGYSETQNFTALRLPLMFQYIAGSAAKTQWYLNAGTKFMLPAKVQLKATTVSITTTGYYPDVNAEVHDLPQHGFGTIDNWQSTGSYSTKAGWLLTGSTGFSFKLSTSGSTRFYAGVYADYGVSNLRGAKEPLSLVSYNSQSVSSILPNGTMSMSGVKDLKLVNFGIQLKLGFGQKQKAKQKSPTVVPLAIVPSISAAKNEDRKVVSQPMASKTTEKKLTPAERKWVEQPMAFGKKNNVSLNTETKQHLDIVAAMLNKYPSSRIVLKGHTCDLGTPAVNDKRSRERASAIANYLTSQGVSKDRMQIIAMGTAEPVAPNTSEEAREQNRRVTITVVE